MPTSFSRTAVSLALGTLAFVVLVTLIQIPRFGQGEDKGEGLHWTGAELQALGLPGDVPAAAVRNPDSGKVRVTGTICDREIDRERVWHHGT